MILVRWSTLRRLPPLLVLIAVGVLVAMVALADGATLHGGRLGGDYPAFYTAGSLALEGRDFYSDAALREAQRTLLPDGTYLRFAYPPPVAAVHALLAWLPYKVAFAIHTLLAFAAVFAAARLAAPFRESIAHAPVLAGSTALCFFPLLDAVRGGQTTPFALLAFAAAARLTHDGRSWAAGLAGAALLLKPQLAPPLLLLWLARGDWRAVGGFALGGVGLAGVSASLFGPGALAAWVGTALRFRDLDSVLNRGKAISLVDQLGGFAPTVPWVGIALGVAGCMAACFVVAARRDEALRDPSWLALLLPIWLFLSPHAQYYDAGLALVALAVDPGDESGRCRRTRRGLTLLAFVLGPMHRWSQVFPMTSMAILTGLAVMALWRAWRAAQESPPTSSTATRSTT